MFLLVRRLFTRRFLLRFFDLRLVNDFPPGSTRLARATLARTLSVALVLGIARLIEAEVVGTGDPVRLGRQWGQNQRPRGTESSAGVRQSR